MASVLELGEKFAETAKVFLKNGGENWWGNVSKKAREALIVAAMAAEQFQKECQQSHTWPWVGCELVKEYEWSGKTAKVLKEAATGGETGTSAALIPPGELIISMEVMPEPDYVLKLTQYKYSALSVAHIPWLPSLFVSY